ncbi:hypothetical protein GC177_03020 [bacterium]|nr:hypothetical protein [bacterium]
MTANTDSWKTLQQAYKALKDFRSVIGTATVDDAEMSGYLAEIIIDFNDMVKNAQNQNFDLALNSIGAIAFKLFGSEVDEDLRQTLKDLRGALQDKFGFPKDQELVGALKNYQTLAHGIQSLNDIEVKLPPNYNDYELGGTDQASFFARRFASAVVNSSFVIIGTDAKSPYHVPWVTGQLNIAVRDMMLQNMDVAPFLAEVTAGTMREAIQVGMHPSQAALMAGKVVGSALRGIEVDKNALGGSTQEMLASIYDDTQAAALSKVLNIGLTNV